MDQACVELAIEESLKEAENGPPGVIPPQTVIEQTKKPQSNIDDAPISEKAAAVTEAKKQVLANLPQQGKMTVGPILKTSHNPYWQIMENSSKHFSGILIFWSSGKFLRPFYLKTYPFFSKFQFKGVTQTLSVENSSIRFLLKSYMICNIWSG